MVVLTSDISGCLAIHEYTHTHLIMLDCLVVFRSRSNAPGIPVSFDTLPLQRTSSYKIRSEDVGSILRCECTMIDIFGRNMEPVSIITDRVLAGNCVHY